MSNSILTKAIAIQQKKNSLELCLESSYDGVGAGVGEGGA